jgi:hypothetical protein
MIGIASGTTDRPTELHLVLRSDNTSTRSLNVCHPGAKRTTCAQCEFLLILTASRPKLSGQRDRDSAVQQATAGPYRLDQAPDRGAADGPHHHGAGRQQFGYQQLRADPRHRQSLPDGWRLQRDVHDLRALAARCRTLGAHLERCCRGSQTCFTIAGTSCFSDGAPTCCMAARSSSRRSSSARSTPASPKAPSPHR